MNRSSLLFAAAVLVSPSAYAAGKKPVPAPLDVVFTNACTIPLELTLGGVGASVPVGQAVLVTVAGRKGDEAVALAMAGPVATELGRFSFTGGGKWNVRLGECADGRADVVASPERDLTGDAPLAMAQVRFRARVRGFLEYQVSGAGAFKPLSVAMTSFFEQKGGEMALQLRKRLAAQAPVLANLKKLAVLAPGRKHVVEVDFSGAVPFISVEDEGPVQ